jgi:arylsulfatase A-like enzyme
MTPVMGISSSRDFNRAADPQNREALRLALNEPPPHHQPYPFWFYNGDPNCETPILDRLASESINVTHAVSGCSVCCPYRASLMTGQYPLTNGVYINDVELDPDCTSIARALPT